MQVLINFTDFCVKILEKVEGFEPARFSCFVTSKLLMGGMFYEESIKAS